MDKMQVLNNFWNSFGVKAYEEHSVPGFEETPKFPYITYESVIDSFNHPVLMTASLFYFSTSLVEISKKVKEISSYIGTTGIIEYCDGGAVWIKRGHPFSFAADDADPKVKRFIINIEAEYITND